MEDASDMVKRLLCRLNVFDPVYHSRGGRSLYAAVHPATMMGSPSVGGIRGKGRRGSRWGPVGPGPEGARAVSTCTRYRPCTCGNCISIVITSVL